MDVRTVSSTFKAGIFMTVVVAVSQAQIRNVQLSSTENSITLTFTPNPSATNYTVSFRLSQGFTYHDYVLSPPYNVSSLSVTHNSALAGSRFTVGVFENDTVRVMEREIATVPLQPQQVTVVARGSSYLLLKWTSTHNLTYEGHEVSYKRQDGNLQVVNATSENSFNLTGLDAGYRYDIYVEAITAGIRSRKSDTLGTLTLPSPPIQLISLTVNDQISVSWQPAPNSYQVQFSHDGSAQTQTAQCSQSPCLISPGGPKGQVIHIFVRAVSNGFRSLPASTEGSTAPGEITELSANERVGGLELSWRAPIASIQESYLLTLRDLRAQTQNFTIPANTTTITHTVDNLIGGYLYEVQVRAISKYAMGNPEVRNFKTFPEPVSNLAGQAINTTALAISWLNPVRSYISSINITVCLPEGYGRDIAIVDRDATSYSLTDLVPGQEYLISVLVYSEYTPSMPSEAVNVTVATKPVKPKLLAVQAQERQLVVILVRRAELGTFDSVQASLLEQVLPPQVTDAEGTLTFTGLDAGTEYTLEAFTLSGREKSDFVYIALFTKPLPPENLVVVAEDFDTMYASWEAPESGGYDNFSVTVVELDSIAHPQMLMTTELFAEFHSLQAGTTYNVSVTAVKSDQHSQGVWDLNTTTKIPASSSNAIVIGAAVGGAVGGAVVVLLMVVVVVVVLRMRTRKPKDLQRGRAVKPQQTDHSYANTLSIASYGNVHGGPVETYPEHTYLNTLPGDSRDYLRSGREETPLGQDHAYLDTCSALSHDDDEDRNVYTLPDD